ncbi:MAG: hypothetical protein WC965_01635 [Thiohalomonadaceae bacterium]
MGIEKPPKGRIDRVQTQEWTVYAVGEEFLTEKQRTQMLEKYQYIRYRGDTHNLFTLKALGHALQSYHESNLRVLREVEHTEETYKLLQDCRAYYNAALWGLKRDKQRLFGLRWITARFAGKTVVIEPPEGFSFSGLKPRVYTVTMYNIYSHPKNETFRVIDSRVPPTLKALKEGKMVVREVTYDEDSGEWTRVS